MNKNGRVFVCALLPGMLLVAGLAQTPEKAAKKASQVEPQTSAPTGSGTQGHIAKWADQLAIGDSQIVEDKFGNVGIGRAADSEVKLFIVAPTTFGTNFGMLGIDAIGGSSGNGSGGHGMQVGGGTATGDSNSGGGDGVFTFGGDGGSAGVGGNGIMAIRGQGPAGNGLAGFFFGDVEVVGNVSKSGGSFKIDHPLDPADKYLYHSFVESPDMMNIYNGNVMLDARGEAIVELPDWFGAINRDFRYALTAIGAPGPNLYIADEVSGNHFRIAGGTPGARVSWTVTGIRQDAWANAHRIPVEEDKPQNERGYFLHPELFEQPEEKGIAWTRNPQLMQRVKQRRLLADKRVSGRNGR